MFAKQTRRFSENRRRRRRECATQFPTVACVAWLPVALTSFLRTTLHRRYVCAHYLLCVREPPRKSPDVLAVLLHARARPTDARE